MAASDPSIHWTDHLGQSHAARWWSLAGLPPPAPVLLVDDHLGLDTAWRRVQTGQGLLWCGSYPQARRLLQALAQRIDRLDAAPMPDGPVPAQVDEPPAAATQPAALSRAFERTRQASACRARCLNLLLLPFDADHGVPLPLAPDVRLAGLEARGPADTHYVAPLRELLGLVGAHEWRRKGVPIAALEAHIHPHHGVFSPVRGEYVDLVAQAALPAAAVRDGAWDVGTGTGVLAAVLARRGLRVTATDVSPAALACAAENLRRLQLDDRVTLQQLDLFGGAPDVRSGLVVCNPPWLPARPASVLDAAVYDPDSRMLRAFLAGLAQRLTPGGEGWLVLSDLAERLGLRSRGDLDVWIAEGGLRVLGRLDTRPRHGRAADRSDPLHAARRSEITSLWRLAPR